MVNLKKKKKQIKQYKLPATYQAFASTNLVWADCCLFSYVKAFGNYQSFGGGETRKEIPKILHVRTNSAPDQQVQLLLFLPDLFLLPAEQSWKIMGLIKQIYLLDKNSVFILCTVSCAAKELFKILLFLTIKRFLRQHHLMSQKQGVWGHKSFRGKNKVAKEAQNITYLWFEVNFGVFVL